MVILKSDLESADSSRSYLRAVPVSDWVTLMSADSFHVKVNFLYLPIQTGLDLLSLSDLDDN